jgi:cation transport ATPase
MPQMPTVILHVQGMQDATAVGAVESKLKGMTGVHRVRINLSQSEARVTYDPYQTTPLEWAEAMAQAGYPIEEK